MTRVEPTTLSIAQVQWANVEPGHPDYMSPQDSKANAAILLRESFAEQGMFPISDPEPGDPTPILVNAERDGWEEVEQPGDANAFIVTWAAKGLPVVEDSPPIPGTRTDDDTYVGVVPPDVVVAGGSVRVRHALDGPVTVTTFQADGEEVVHLLYVELSPDEAHVELYAGTKKVVVVRTTAEDEDETDGPA